MNQLADLMVYVTTVVIYLFGFGYGFFAPWWRSSMGRNVMAMTVTHGLIFTLISVNLIFGLSWTARPVVRVLTYGSILFVFAWRGMILLREQILARHETPVEPVFRRKDTLMWGKYGKAIAQVVMAVLVVGATVTSGDGNVSDEEKFQLATAFVSAIAVYLVPAVPEWPWMKTAVAALLAALTTAGSVALDGLSTNDIIVIVIAAFGVGLTAIAPTNTEQRHRSTNHPTVALLLVLALAVSVGATYDATPARADSASEISSCYVANPTGAGPSWQGGNYDGAGDWYSYSPLYRTLNASACEDINLIDRFGATDDRWYRVRFYPSSGGSYANSWKGPNINWGCNCNNMLVATDVLNNTLFRIESHRRVGSTQIVEDTKFTLAW